ncbi:MAG TPA: PIN domain-containing protein [Acidimicrobiales bacterium]|nr:PIN domain-containing protein [Acidimicrobiales bacterium]
MRSSLFTPSAGRHPGTTAAVLDFWLDERVYQPVVCPMLLEELEEVLSRPKFQALEPSVVHLLLDRLRTESDYVEDPLVESGVTDDPDDDYLVALARQAGASFIVSGDPHLHVRETVGVRVLHPREFLDRISQIPDRGDFSE